MLHDGYCTFHCNCTTPAVYEAVASVKEFLESTVIANIIGEQKVIAEIQFDRSAEFNAASLEPFTVDGELYGSYKTTGQLSFVIIEQAGHQVPAFQPKASLELFRQIMSKERLHST